MLRNILITGCLSIFLAVLAGSASSRAEDIISSKETADAVWNTSNQEAQTLSELNKQVKTKLESNTNDFGKFLIQQETDRKIKEASVPRSTYMLSVLFSALPTTQFTFEQVRTTLHNIVFEAMEGRPIVANADSTSTGPATDINAFAKSTPIAIDAMLVK
ncbi:MAG: hypothetical protein JWM96_996, partial [Alphaproteobacteria bacterium]|nr:hypothetical protein [Alphaproteobacteria bacterium]